MDTMASKNSAANGSDRASAWIGKTPSSTPASRMRWRFSEALNHRSVAQTCTPNSRRRKIDDIARPQPRSSTRMPGRRSSASASHSVSHSELAPPLTPASTHSGWYAEARGNRSEIKRESVITRSSVGPNASSSATRPAGRVDCNRDAGLAGFAAALVRCFLYHSRLFRRGGEMAQNAQSRSDQEGHVVSHYPNLLTLQPTPKAQTARSKCEAPSISVGIVHVEQMQTAFVVQNVSNLCLVRNLGKQLLNGLMNGFVWRHRECITLDSLPIRSHKFLCESLKLGVCDDIHDAAANDQA